MRWKHVHQKRAEPTKLAGVSSIVPGVGSLSHTQKQWQHFQKNIGEIQQSERRKTSHVDEGTTFEDP
jgi:hypothetical protein